MGLSNGKIEITKAANTAWLEVRKQWSVNDAARDKDLCEPNGIIKLRNLDYKAPFDKTKINMMLEAEKRINCPDFASAEYVSSSLFDVYMPHADTEKYPVILSVHGGGWFYGDKELYRFYCMDMAKRGFAVINMNYRLAPENIYPAAIEDVCLCVKYISEHAEALKLDMDHFYMVGDSAGAQLVTNYSIIATNEAYRRLVDFETCDIVPKAVALNCGIYEMRNMQGEVYDWYMYGKSPDKSDCEVAADEIVKVSECEVTANDIAKESECEVTADDIAKESDCEVAADDIAEKSDCEVTANDIAKESECEVTVNEITGKLECEGLADGIIRKPDRNRLDLFCTQLDYLTDKFPPAYIMCSINDALMVHTAAMKKKLEDLNIRHVYREYGQENPNSGHVFHLNLYNPEGRKCNDEEAEFFA